MRTIPTHQQLLLFLQEEEGVRDRHVRVETVSHRELHVCSGSLSLGFGVLGLELMGCVD